MPTMHKSFNLMKRPTSFHVIHNLCTAQLPQLPVPKLQDTLNKCLRSLKPLTSAEEFKQTESVVKKFSEPNGLGEQLQNLLLKRAETEENWLSHWWLHSAYLEYRLPVTVYSSPGLVMPRQNFQSREQQLQFATQLILAVLDFKSLIDKDFIKPEMMGNDPLDMAQYKKVFGTCRLPKIPQDQLVYHPQSRHIIVLYRNNIVKLTVLTKEGLCYSQQELYAALHLIPEMTEKDASPVGVLTADNRDSWSKAYTLLSQDPNNKEVLKTIESALFVVCLDQASGPEGVDDTTNTGLQTIHGGGPISNGGNRWFDKTTQFIVSEEGRIGLTYEHSPAEGQPIASIVDYIMDYLKSNKASEVPGGNATAASLCTPLSFNVNNEVQAAIRASAANMEQLVMNLDALSYSFDTYGKDFIKSQKLSPDSFIQMAIQFAFYRLHKVAGAQYESASTRKFIHGRTETIRSCSVESVEFAQTMLSSTSTPHQKLSALKNAVKSHKDYTVQALNGQGVDRHLLGLKLTALTHGLPMPPLFSDPGYLKGLHMRLSTSQVAVKSDGFMIYGPLVDDGYGCCYNPRRDDIKFGLTSFNSWTETSTIKFKESLKNSLLDMHNLLASTPTAHL